MTHKHRWDLVGLTSAGHLVVGCMDCEDTYTFDRPFDKMRKSEYVDLALNLGYEVVI